MMASVSFVASTSLILNMLKKPCYRSEHMVLRTEGMESVAVEPVEEVVTEVDTKMKHWEDAKNGIGLRMNVFAVGASLHRMLEVLNGNYFSSHFNLFVGFCSWGTDELFRLWGFRLNDN